MIVKYFLVILCILIIETNAGMIDCKRIDSQKFKELFNFKYSGGSVGLKFDFMTTKNNFKIENCKFEIIKVRTTAVGDKSYSIHPKDKLNNLKACSKYNVTIDIKNLENKLNFQYGSFVTTRPNANITKIKLYIQEIGDSFASFSWNTTSVHECIEKYVAILKDEKNNVVKNMTIKNDNEVFKFDDLVSLKSYTAQIVAMDDKGSKILSNEQKIEWKVLQLQLVNVTENSVLLKWNVDDEIKGIFEYRLEIVDQDGKLELNNTFSNTSVQVMNLQGCTEYSAKLFMNGSEDFSKLSFKTRESPPGSVAAIYYSADDKNSKISWKHPEINPKCVQSYAIKATRSKDINEKSKFLVEKTIAKNQTDFVTKRLPYSKKIFIHVYVNYDTFDNATTKLKSEEFENFNIDEFTVSTIQEFRRSPTEMQLSWGFDTSYLASDILDYFEIFFEGSSYKTNKSLINLTIQVCKKNYTVIIRCASKGGQIGRNVTYDMKLNDNDYLLSEINQNNIKVSQSGNESLLIVWQPDVYEAPCIAYYEIEFAEEVFNVSDSKLEINKFDSCMIYQIYITPISMSGNIGHKTEYDFETNVLAPNRPSKPSLVYSGNRELKISSSISDNDKRCVGKVQLSIEFMCNNVVVEEIITSSQSQYSVKIPNLQPNTKYECTAKVKNSNQTSEKSESSVFETLQDSPQPPNEISTVIHDNYVNVKWRANNSTGFADYYHIHLSFMKFLYDFGKNCDKKFKNSSVLEAIAPYLNLTKLLPFSQYKLKIIAINSYGKSNFSKEIIFNTSPSSPTEPRNPKVELKSNHNSTVSAFLSWVPPCMMNGKFSFYTITICGQDKVGSMDKRIEGSTTEQFELYDLKHGFIYNVEIQAVNQKQGSTKISGKIAKFSFETPAGIPEEEDLKNWTLFGSTLDKVHAGNIEILLKRRMLVSKQGDITGITFLIFLSDCPDPPQPTFGYLSNINKSLPSAQNNLNCSQLYQQTDFLENSLKYDDESNLGALDNYTVKFIIGDEDCSGLGKTYCNGPMTCENCNYGLMARVFTSNGFRDTEPVYFETRSDSPLIHRSTILLVSSSLLALILISCVVCSLCCIHMRRQKQKLKKKKETAETVENLLSFTSYCVIDKNPTPKYQFDHLL